ncbi:MAG: hypothetical protein H6733_09220 [Alphaproteobacteria bacterium]|nr:hypothetical protein [Alphaproteobacteria bacterium]
MRHLVLPAAAIAVSLACGGSAPEPAPAEQVNDKCPRVGMDAMAGDWVLATGDVKTRFRVLQRGGDTVLWYVDPSFSNHKLELVGTRHEHDWQFDERPTGPRKRLIDSGGEQPKRVYLQPRLSKCAVEVLVGSVDADGKETIAPRPKEFLQFPDNAGVVLSYQPPDAPLFFNDAAKDHAKAAQELADGGPRIDVPSGAIVAGAWSEADADGDAACTYTFDAWFDSQPLEAGKEQPAGEVVDGARPWTYAYDAPYGGNHTFELYRYRACNGGARELIGVSGSDAALN